jgi:hypothetical protein
MCLLSAASCRALPPQVATNPSILLSLLQLAISALVLATLNLMSLISAIIASTLLSVSRRQRGAAAACVPMARTGRSPPPPRLPCGCVLPSAGLRCCRC